jgi:hypothetical protein
VESSTFDKNLQGARSGSFKPLKNLKVLFDLFEFDFDYIYSDSVSVNSSKELCYTLFYTISVFVSTIALERLF